MAVMRLGLVVIADVLFRSRRWKARADQLDGGLAREGAGDDPERTTERRCAASICRETRFCSIRRLASEVGGVLTRGEAWLIRRAAGQAELQVRIKT